jgi:RNA polymerase sigma-70 factor (ECF subfamily)
VAVPISKRGHNTQHDALIPADAEPGGASGPPSRSDAELAAAGDRDAFERIYRQHVSRVYSLVLRMTQDRQRAEELTQDVFVRAWERIGKFRGDSLISTWLHRVAVNIVLGAFESGKRESLRHGAVAADDIAPLRYTRPGGERLDLETAIARLPRRARAVFLLHDVEGYRHEEIGEMLGITSGGSKAQLHRARMLLRESLER